MGNPLESHQGLEQKIKAEAFRLGFSLCGITTPDIMGEFPRYESWLVKGLNAGMSYLSMQYHRSSRKDPHSMMSNVRSIISLAYPYPLHSSGDLSTTEKCFVAGYATGRDYHLELPEKLSFLVKYIEALYQQTVDHRIFTDSSPILERELASRAGLGWIGKNSLLINPVIGSSFLLAELFIDLELAPDVPFSDDKCGTCQRCLTACPTKCINPDRTIDSNRCLSYNTIENKLQISTDIADKLAPWVFGCDICQMVCPWNKNRVTTEKPLSYTSNQLIEFLKMDAESFSRYFHQSAVQRAKFEGFIRNILINLIDVDRSTSLPAIKAYIENSTNSELVALGVRAIEIIQKKPPL